MGEVLIESRQYASLDALIQNELRDLDFDDLTYASDAQLAVFHAHENAQLKEMPSLDPSVQPVVTILWSESDKLQEGEKLPLARADALFQTLDAERRAEREKPGHTGGWYDKTALDSLGIDIEKPFETSPLEPDENGMLEYCGCQYIVFGNCDLKYHYRIGSVEFRVATSYPSTGIEQKHFVIELYPVQLKFICKT